MNDFQFKGMNNNHLHVVGKRSRSALIELTWSFQKNNDNGQKITFAKSKSNSKLCFVEAAKRVVKSERKIWKSVIVKQSLSSQNQRTIKHSNTLMLVM